jgi:hypothetical protein
MPGGLVFSWLAKGGALKRRGRTDSPGGGGTPPTAILPATLAGSAPVGTASYATVSGALYVDPVAGNDANSGTLNSPFRTVVKAISAVAIGGTIILRAGTYHEGVVGTAGAYGGISITKAGVTIQNYPGEAVWFDGSSPVSGWVVDGSNWRHDGWTLKLDRSPTFTFGVPDDTRPSWQFVNPLYPTAAWPEELFIDGVPKTQVNSLAAVGPGKFFIDQTNQKVYIGDNPAGREVRITDLQVTIVALAANITFRGLGFRRFAPSMPHLGAVKLLRDGDVMENCWFEDISAQSLSCQSGSNIQVRNVTILRAGNMGIHCNNADHILFSRIRVQYANTRLFNPAPASGGIKITRLVDCTVKESVFLDCYTHAVWCDESVALGKIYTCDVQRCAGYGIVMELGGDTIIANCLVTDTGQSGIKVINTDTLQMWNCTVYNACSVTPDPWNVGHTSGRAVDITADDRSPMTSSSVGLDTRKSFPRTDVSMDWVMTQALVKNTIMAKLPFAQGVITIEDYKKNTGTARAWQAFGPDWDGNFYNRLDTSHPTWFSILTNAGAANPSIDFSMSAEHTRTGMDTHSVAVDGADAMNADYTVKPAYKTQVEAGAQPLPSAIATLIGQPAGTLHVGSFR